MRVFFFVVIFGILVLTAGESGAQSQPGGQLTIAQW
jgi:hypothetical protein